MATESIKKLREELIAAKEEAIQLTKEYKAFLDLIKLSGKSIEEAMKSLDLGDSKGITSLNDALAQTNELTEEQIDINKELSKQKKKTADINTKLATLQSEENKELTKNRILLQEATKQAKISATAELGLIDAYGEKAARLTKLRREYKSLIISEGKSTKQTNKLKKEVIALDKELKELDESVGQNQRSVGQYEKAVEKLNKTVGKLGIAALIAKGVQLLGSAFGDNRDGALELEKASNKLIGTMKVLKVALVDSFEGAKEIFFAIGDSFVSLGKKAEVASINTKLLFSRLLSNDTINKLNNELKVLNGEIEELGKSSVGGGLDKITSSFDDFDDRVVETIKNMDTISKVTQDYDIRIQALTRTISKLTTAQRINLLIAENDTLNFKIREEASVKAVDQAVKLGKQQRELGRLELDLQNQRITSALITAQVVEKGSKLSSNAIIQLLKVRENAGKISKELEDDFTAAFIENQNAQLESSDILLDTLEKQNKLFSDLQELILDIQLDGLDNQKTINEKIIANEQETFDVRVDLLNRTKQLFEDGFEAQKNTIIKLNNEVLASEKIRINNSVILTKAQKTAQLAELDRQEAALTGAEIDKIVAEDDAVIQAEKILALGLNEKFTLRLLEIIKDFRTGNQDLAESEQELGESLKEGAELKEQIALQEEALNSKSKGRFDKLEQDRFEQEVAALRRRINLLKEDSVERLRLQEELNGKLLEKQESDQDKANKMLEDDLAKQEELYQKSAEVIGTIFDKLFEKRNEQIDKDLDATQEAQEKIQKGIEAGNEDAKKSLAVEEKREAELLAKKEKARKNQIRAEAAIALFKAYGESGGDLGKTIADTAVLTALINSLSFFHGTDETPDEVMFNDKHGGVTGFVHKKEQVWSQKDRSDVGYRTRDEIKDIVNRDLITDPTQAIYMAQVDNSSLEAKVDTMTQSILTLHKRMPKHSSSYNGRTKEHEDIIEYNNKKEILRTKSDAWV